jgi:NADH:ubiquinone oxidoreductase subunit F (NADH-binding)
MLHNALKMESNTLQEIIDKTGLQNIQQVHSKRCGDDHTIHWASMRKAVYNIKFYQPFFKSNTFSQCQECHTGTRKFVFHDNSEIIFNF